eukprot:jgi/Mesvir1/3367/Mv05030-RA.1
MAALDPLADASEVTPGRLYFIPIKRIASLRHSPLARAGHCFCVDEELVYQPFFADFGPLNLGQTYRYCELLRHILKDTAAEGKKVFHITSGDPHKLANSAVLALGLGPWLWSCNCAAGASNHRFIPQPGGPDQRRTDLAPWAARGTDGSSGDCGPLETSETGSSADDSNQLGASKEFNDHNQSSSQVVAAGSKRSNYEVLADGASTKGSTGMVAATKEQSPAVKAAISMLKFYKGMISPLIPWSCRYIPTCSEYAMQAYAKYGVLKGTALTACRLLRCNPFGGYGYDPPRWIGEPPPPEL